MPTNDLIHTQLDASTLRTCIDSLRTILTVLAPFSQNLTAEERQRYGSINEQNKLLVTKVLDYYQTDPGMISPDLNWNALQQSWESRHGFEQLETLCANISEMCSDARILHDYFLYQGALTDYHYTKYKAENTQGPGAWTTKMDAIKQLFPNPSGNNTPAPPAE